MTLLYWIYVIYIFYMLRTVQQHMSASWASSSSLLFLLVVMMTSVAVVKAEVDQDVYDLADQGFLPRVMIRFDGGIEEALQQHEANRLAEGLETKGAIRRSLLDSLQSHADITHGPYLQYLSNTLDTLGAFDHRFTYKSYAISNSIGIRGATRALLEGIEGEFGAGSHRIVLQKTAFINAASLREAAQQEEEEENVNWNTAMINAGIAWNNDITGEGVVVAILDTGVTASHEVFSTYGGDEHGWYNAVMEHDHGQTTDKAYDDDYYGHGTHVAGTIAGGNKYGVAPGATFTACRACTWSSGCAEDVLTACAEWLVCPEDDEECALGADVVNNSWGSAGGSGEDYFDDVLNVWKSAGIIPVFAAGNSGVTVDESFNVVDTDVCGSITYPAQSADVIAVGATNSEYAASAFSSRGVALDAQTKPDVVAPGEGIISAANTELGTEYYTTLTGTSNACPHVAGVVALLLQQGTFTSFDDIRSQITSTAVTDTLLDVGSECYGDDSSFDTFPNNVYGHGMINAAQALGLEANLISKFPALSRRTFKVSVGVDFTLTSFAENENNGDLNSDTSGGCRRKLRR